MLDWNIYCHNRNHLILNEDSRMSVDEFIAGDDWSIWWQWVIAQTWSYNIMAAVPNITPSLILKLKKKAIAGRIKFRIAAIAFSRKGNVLGMEVNSCISRRISYEEYSKRCITKESCKFSGKHAERALMEKYGKRIAYPFSSCVLDTVEIFVLFSRVTCVRRLQTSLV